MQPPVFKPRDCFGCGKARTVEVKQKRNRELGTGAEPIGKGTACGDEDCKNDRADEHDNQRVGAFFREFGEHVLN